MNRYKVALCFICLNEPYWIFLDRVIESARKFFLQGHDVDYLVWSDMPIDRMKTKDVKVFPTESMTWPMPTLHRYHLFLQQEELLKEYDYVLYCDCDMLFVSKVGDEVLGEGLTMAQHPMYAISKMFVPPYEPNEKSTS